MAGAPLTMKIGTFCTLLTVAVISCLLRLIDSWVIVNVGLPLSEIVIPPDVLIDPLVDEVDL